MVDPLSIVTTLGQGALKLKATIEQLSDNQEDIRSLTTELINGIEDLTTLRKNCATERMSGLDRTLDNLIRELAVVCVGCEALIPQERTGRIRRSVKWVMGLYNAGTVKKKIVRLDKRVHDAQMRFMVMTSALTLQKVTAPECNRVSRRLTIIDLALCSKEEKLTLIRIKVRSLEISLENATLILGTSTDVSDSYWPEPDDPFYGVITDYDGIWRRDDALSEIVTLLDILQDPAEIAATSIIDRFTRADRLSWAMSTLGLREESATLSSIWSEIIRKLADGDHQSLQDYKARALLGLSRGLGNVGRREEALEAIEEAVGIRRDLVKESPDEFNADLALSLNNMSNDLGDVGRREEALAAVEEAVGIRRDLARWNPDEFNPDLAVSLNDLSVRLSCVGKRDEALAAVEEAVEVRRDLARRNPDAFKSALADSLNTLSNCLSDVGNKEDALMAIEEAVVIARDLVRRNPDAFNPSLVTKLNNLSNCLSDAGKTEEALATIEETVKICRDLARRNPGAFNPVLGGSLNNLSIRLNNVGMRKEALRTIKEAVGIHRGLARRNPDAFNPVLAHSLYNLALMYSIEEQWDEVIKPVRESVNIYQALAQRYPAAFDRTFAQALAVLNNCLRKLGQVDEAFEDQEAVRVYNILQ